jgi:hypothetical protein
LKNYLLNSINIQNFKKNWIFSIWFKN